MDEDLRRMLLRKRGFRTVVHEAIYSDLHHFLHRNLGLLEARCEAILGELQGDCLRNVSA